MNTTASDELNTLDGERGLPSVNEAKPTNRGRWLLMSFLLLFVVAVGVMLFYLTFPKAKPAEAKSEAETSTLPEKKFVLEAKPALPGATATVPAVETAAVPVEQPTASGGVATEPVQKPATLDRSASELMITGTDAPETGGDPAAAGYAAGATPARGQAASGPLAGLLAGTETPAGKATVLANRDFLVAKGAFIDCALQTRLDSTVPGMTACVVTRNVYSDNGRFVLIERGSTVIGEYQSNMKQGMARIYVLWTRVKTPNGVIVNLDSPGADALGGAGLPGYVDNHFWKRFGGAILLSLIQDAAQYASDRQRGSGSGGNRIALDSTANAPSDAASIALENTINIPPTLYKNQGERVGIYVARDLDFSGVYSADLR